MPLTMSIARRSSVIEASSVRKPAWAMSVTVHGGKRVIGSQRFGVEHVEAIPDGMLRIHERRHFLIGAAATAANLLTPDTSRSQSDIGPHLAVSYEDPGQAIALDFIGLSYEFGDPGWRRLLHTEQRLDAWADPSARRERRPFASAATRVNAPSGVLMRNLWGS